MGTADIAPFCGQRVAPAAVATRQRAASRLMPAIRGLIGQGEYQVGHFDDSDTVLTFVSAVDMPKLAALGTSRPDHFLRTKIRP